VTFVSYPHQEGGSHWLTFQQWIMRIYLHASVLLLFCCL